MSAEPFEIRGEGGDTIAVRAGEYYFNTKARARRMMLNSLSSDARRAYACLELATMGYQQELAVLMERGKQRPLTPGGIVRQTGLSKQNLRRALEELEAAGLAERRADDGGPLRNGHMTIYSWATLRPRPKEEKGSRARLPFPDWFPASWEPLKPLITRLKLDLAIDEVGARDFTLRQSPAVWFPD
ncbi:MAG: helix-turn-helix domain-containing protein [Bryobacteraceae bacterium]|nr:helix-turn-helix domain-containing protein [Bryobacteraceae bacterium]